MSCLLQGDLVAVGVLSGNRNFEGRIHPLTRANYLASPPLVIAYAIAGTLNIDFDKEPIGNDCVNLNICFHSGEIKPILSQNLCHVTLVNLF